MKKALIVFVAIIIALFLFYLVGPKPNYKLGSPIIDDFEIPLVHLQDFIEKRESLIKDLRPGNESVLQWADSTVKTEYAVVFLHGFSASPMEGNPTAYELAKHLNANLYIPLLADHGRKLGEENFLNLTPKALIESAKQAIAVANAIGEKVIVISSSTGGTLSSYLAAHNPTKIHAQIMCSPNIQIAKAGTDMLIGPWGLQIARMIFGGKNRSYTLDEAEAMNYWTHRYRLEGVQCLASLVKMTMTDEAFAKINQPTFVAYYYKDENNKDEVVSIPAMHDFINKINTPKSQQKIEAYGEVGAHVMTSKFQSKDRSRLKTDIFKFVDGLDSN